MTRGRRRTRRLPVGALAALAVAALATQVAGTVGDTPPVQPLATGSRSAADSPAKSTVAPPDAPELPRWRASRHDVSPEVKKTAARVLTTLTEWRAGQGGAATATRRAADLPIEPAAVEALRPWLSADGDRVAASATVTSAQYGGLGKDRASVMLTVRQKLRAARQPTQFRELTVDVRLARRGSTWTVVALHPTDGSCPTPALLSDAAQRLLASPRLHLPAAARADLSCGRVGEELITLLARLIERHEISVSVLHSGHPAEVFGTDRLSNHTKGAAVDIWAVDGRPVVDPASRPAVQSLLAEAVKAGAPEIGAPFDPDGPRGVFANALHRDHLHLSVRQ